MTICVAVKVDDCVVFAADSAVTLNYGKDQAGADIINVLPHGHKVFNLHRDLPICAMTCGLGNIGNASIAHLAKDLRLEMMSHDGPYQIDPDNYTVEEVAQKARRFLFEERFSKLPVKPQIDMSFYVGGFSSKEPTGEVWLVQIDGTTGTAPEPVCPSPRGQCGLVWGGQSEAISRLMMGFSPQLSVVLTKAGVDAALLATINEELAGSLQAAMIHPAMPVQDAIDLADFLVETTKRFVRFLPGADTVGGDTDIAAITKHEGFKWVKRKHYFGHTLNPAEVSYGARYPAEKGKPGQTGGAEGD